MLPDSKWDDLKDRLIYVKQVKFGSSIEADPVTEATVERDVDMAQIYLQPFNASTLSISTAEIPAGGTVDVGSWANDDRNAKFQVVELLSIHDPDHLHLSGIYVPSHSGSPVLDGQGRVAGMLVERVTSINSPPATIGLALPAKSLMQVLSPVIPSRQTKKTELAPRNVVNFAQLGGCLFLGKRSARHCRQTRRLEYDRWPSLVEKPVKIVSHIDLRSRCPIVIDGTAYYGRVIYQLVPGEFGSDQVD